MKPGFSGSFLLLLVSASMAFAGPPTVTHPAAWRLLTQAQSHAPGIYLDELVESPAPPLPHIRLASAPAVGQAVTLTRAQVTTLLRQAAPEFAPTNWTGSS